MPGGSLRGPSYATPMTLGNMRANGVRTLGVWCGAHRCNHHGVLDVTSYSDGVPVPAFGPRMVCTVCGAIGADARPNWNEREQASSPSLMAILLRRSA
jgi:hypothetical protein